MRWCKWSQKKLKLYFLTLNEVFKFDWLVCITEYWLDENKNIKTKDLVILNNRIQLIDYYRDNTYFICDIMSRYSKVVEKG